MKKLAILLLFPSLAFAQVQVQGKPGGAIQIGGNQPGVSSIQGATGDFTFTGDGFSGCTTSGGVTTCTFTGGASSTTPSVVPPAHWYGLVGAFTDSAGNVIEPIWIGKGPMTIAAPEGATQLQLGVNDDILSGNSGSWTISVNGSNYTVDGTARAWMNTGGINSRYPVTTIGGTSPTVVTGISFPVPVVISYVSGSIASGSGVACVGGSASPFDAGGEYGCYFTGISSNTSSYGFGHWVVVPPSISPNPMTTLGDLTVGGIDGYPIRLPASAGYLHWNGLGFVYDTPSGGGGTPGGTTGQIQYNNGGVFGGDSGSTTDGAGNVTTKTLSTTGTAGAGGLLKAVEGTAPSAAAGYDILYADSASHCFKQSLNGGSFACLGTGSGSLNVNGSPVSSPNLQDSATVTFGVSGSNITATAAGGSGGYTNIAGSGSQTTVAAINTLCGTGTLYATTPLSIATGGTVSCPVQFSKSGLWTVASGQTVTFSKAITETDGPNQHFAGSGLVVISPSQTDIWSEWWGGVNDGNLTANTGTDNYPATQAAITSAQSGGGSVKIHYQGGFYRFTSGTPTVTASNIGLKGALVGGNSGPTSTSKQTIWFASTSTLGNVKFAGSSGTHIKWNSIDAITFARAVAPSTTVGQATGIDLEWTEGFSLTNYRVEDSGPYGIFMTFPDAAFSGTMSQGAVEWGYNGIDPSAGTYYCYFIDASQPTFSWVPNHYGCLTNNKANSTHIFYGVYANGTIFSDIMSDWFQTSLITTSVYLNWTGGGGFANSDINFSNNVFDSNTGPCIYVNGATSDAASINFRGGACNTIYPSGPAYGVEVHSSSGVNITDMEFGQVGSTAVAYFDTATYSSFKGNHIWLNTGDGGGIKINATSSSLFTDNDIRGGNSTSTLISLLGSSNNIVRDNVLNGTASIGLALDGTSNNNSASNGLNTILGSITTPISDSGSGNALSVTVANNLNGGALGSLPYQSAANTTAFVASPTTTGHTFVPAWQPSGSAIAPAALDLGTYLASPPAIGGTTPAAGSFSSLKDTGAAAGTGSACLQIDTAGTISNTGTACGTGGGGGTNVQVNGGSTLTTSNQTGVLPYNCSDSSGSGTAQSCTTSTSFTLSSGNCFVYKTTTANSGSGLTLAINGGSALTVRVASATGWTSTLQSSPASIPANQPMLACYDGTNVNMSSTGNSAPLGSNGLFVFTPPVPGNFTWTNQGSCTTNTSDPNTLFVSCPNNGGADNIRSLLENVPGSTPYTKTMWFSSDLPSLNYLIKGMAMTDGTKYLTLAYESNSNDCTGNGWAVAVIYWTAANTFSSTIAKTCIQALPWIGLKITVSGGTDTYSYSKDGVHWIQLFSETDHTHLTQTKIGMFENPNNSTYGLDMTVASWTDQ